MSRLPENYRGRGAFADIAAFQNRVAKRLNNVKVFGNGRVDLQEEAIVLYLNDTDLSLLDFWYDVKGASTLHVNGGRVPILGQNLAVAAVDVDCPGDDTGALYVYLEVNVGNKAASISPVAVSSEPVAELGIMRKVLYELHKASGSIVIDAIRITDPWVLPLFVE